MGPSGTAAPPRQQQRWPVRLRPQGHARRRRGFACCANGRQTFPASAQCLSYRPRQAAHPAPAALPGLAPQGCGRAAHLDGVGVQAVGRALVERHPWRSLHLRQPLQNLVPAATKVWQPWGGGEGERGGFECRRQTNKPRALLAAGAARRSV